MTTSERRLCWGMLAILAVAGLDCGLDPDLGWHVRAGQYMVQTRSVIRHDPFSWTMPGYPWVDHEWATDTVTALLYGAGGLTALGLVMALVIAAAAVFVFLNRGRDVPPGTQAMVVLVLFVVVMPPIIGIRPQMLSLMFLALVALLTSRNLAAGRWSSRLVWLLPLLFCAWANMHGGFAAGLLYLAIVWFARAVEAAQRARQERGDVLGAIRRNAGQLGVVILACIAATFVNAYGSAIYREIFQTATDKLEMARIGEWQAPEMSPTFAVFWLLVIASPILAWLSRRPTRLEEALLYVVFMAMAVHSARNVAVAMVVIGPILAAHVAAAWPRLGRELAATPAWFGVALVIMAAGLGAVRLHTTGACWTDEAAYGREGKFPYLAVADIAKEPPDSRGMCMYAWGGYLLRRLPDRKVFIDGRMAIWHQDGHQVFADYDKLYNAAPGCLDLLKRYRFDWILVPTDAPLGEILRAQGGWRAHEYGDTSVLWTPVPAGA